MNPALGKILAELGPYGVFVVLLGISHSLIDGKLNKILVMLERKATFTWCEEKFQTKETCEAKHGSG